MVKRELLLAAGLLGFFLGFSFIILHAIYQHQPTWQRIEAGRPEFGTYPPDCKGLPHEQWADCMGVGYK